MDMFQANDIHTLVLACSGGPDSMYLLDRTRQETQHKIHVIHVHHGLREDASIDERIVVNYCKKHDIPCVIEHADVEAYAKTHKLSTEEAGRVVRQELYQELRKKISADFIVTAHHKDDLVETILYRLIRGTGIYGFIGMKQKNGVLLKPLLSIEKKQILQYLIEQDLPFAIDASNETTVYDRNYIRHNIIPEMEKINTSYRDNIAGLSKQAKSYESYIESIFTDQYTQKKFETQWYTELHPHLQNEWIHYIYKKENNGTIGISKANISELDRYITTAKGGTKKEVQKLFLEKKNNIISLR